VEYVKYGGRDVPVSDREKTLLDFVYFRQPLEKEVLRVLKRRVDKKKLRSYLRQSNREFRRRFEKETGWKV